VRGISSCQFGRHRYAKITFVNTVIRNHALKTVHDHKDLDSFTEAMVAFGRTLPPIASPTAKDPHYSGLCRGSARWAWERRDTIWRD